MKALKEGAWDIGLVEAVGKGILSEFGDKPYRAYDFGQHTPFWYKENTEEKEGDRMAEGGKDESKMFQDTMEI